MRRFFRVSTLFYILEVWAIVLTVVVSSGVFHSTAPQRVFSTVVTSLAIAAFQFIGDSFRETELSIEAAEKEFKSAEQPYVSYTAVGKCGCGGTLYEIISTTEPPNSTERRCFCDSCTAEFYIRNKFN